MHPMHWERSAVPIRPRTRSGHRHFARLLYNTTAMNTTTNDDKNNYNEAVLGRSHAFPAN